jgi:Ca-activated chloride channel family protein
MRRGRWLMGSELVKKSSGGLAAAVKADAQARRVNVQESLVLVVDCSGSMGVPVDNRPSSMTKAKAAAEAASALIKASSPLSAIGAVAFSDIVHETVPIGHDRRKLVSAIQEFNRFSGGTFFYHAMVEAEKLIIAHSHASDAKVKRIILLSDGQDAYEYRSHLEGLLETFMGSKILVDTVAFGADADLASLESIAKRTGGVMKEAKDAASLTKAFLALEAGVRGLLGKGGA